MRVQDSQAYRKMDVTRERISRVLELREMFLSFQTGFNLVNAVVVCAILVSISGLEPSVRYNGAMVLEACDCLKLLSVHFVLCVDSADVVMNLVFSALISMPMLWRLCRNAQLILVVLPLLLDHRRHQQSGDW